MRSSRLLLTLGALSLAIGVGSAMGQTTPATCIAQAKADYAACRAQCKQDFLDARFSCRGVDPQCGEACLAGREACMENVQNVLETGMLPGGSDLPNCTGGTDQCKANFKAAKTACGAPCDPSNQQCIDCVNQAQVQNFICRDTCRDSWRTNPTVIAMRQSCRDSFRACVGACPPAS